MAYILNTAQHPIIKFIKAFVIVLLIIAVAGAYLYFNPSIWQPWVKGTPLEASPSITHLYKWQDDDGEWQFTDTPPQKPDIKYEVLEYQSDTNVLPLVPREDN